MTTEHDQGDYVLVHKSKAKISRARKMIIGVMAIGAVAAMTNAGTFASFSAATQNDATFQSGRIVLTNAVPGGQTCFSDGTAADNTESANLNTNNNTSCTGLGFGTFLVPGSIATANITLVNKSDTAAPLSVFATAACANANNVTGGYSGPFGTGSPCAKIQMYVQEFTDAGFTTKTSKCIFPRNLSANCLTNFTDATNTMGDFPATLANKVDLTDVSTTIPVNGIRYFQVATKFPDAGADAAGNGADNAYQRRQANLILRWLLTQ